MWAIIFLVVGLVLGALGFGGVGGAFVGIAKILFFVAIALFVIFLGCWRAGRRSRSCNDPLRGAVADDPHALSRAHARLCRPPRLA